MTYPDPARGNMNLEIDHYGLINGSIGFVADARIDKSCRSSAESAITAVNVTKNVQAK